MSTCRKCGTDNRFPSGSCKTCRRIYDAANAKRIYEYNKQVRLANPAKKAAHDAKYRANHKDVIKANYKKWVEADPVRALNSQREGSKRWNAAHPDKINISLAKRRATKKGATPAWANEFIIEEIYDLAVRRTRATGFKWQVDHIVPLQSKLVCGLHWELNLQVIPEVVNKSKGNRYWPDMPDCMERIVG